MSGMHIMMSEKFYSRQSIGLCPNSKISSSAGVNEAQIAYFSKLLNISLYNMVIMTRVVIFLQNEPQQPRGPPEGTLHVCTKSMKIEIGMLG